TKDRAMEVQRIGSRPDEAVGRPSRPACERWPGAKITLGLVGEAPCCLRTALEMWLAGARPGRSGEELAAPHKNDDNPSAFKPPVPSAAIGITNDVLKRGGRRLHVRAQQHREFISFGGVLKRLESCRREWRLPVEQVLTSSTPKRSRLLGGDQHVE